MMPSRWCCRSTSRTLEDGATEAFHQRGIDPGDAGRLLLSLISGAGEHLQRRRSSGRASRTVTSLAEGGMMRSLCLHAAGPDNEIHACLVSDQTRNSQPPGPICQIMRLSA